MALSRVTRSDRIVSDRRRSLLRKEQIDRITSLPVHLDFLGNHADLLILRHLADSVFRIFSPIEGDAAQLRDRLERRRHRDERAAEVGAERPQDAADGVDVVGDIPLQPRLRHVPPPELAQGP